MRWMKRSDRGGRPAAGFPTATAALWAAAALWALTGCAPSSVPVLIEHGADGKADRKWEKYGAYYVVDEVFVETSFEKAVVKAPLNRYIINKKIKILTLDGARFGTVEAPVISLSPRAFKLEHWDSAGRPMKLDLAAIRGEYLKSGKIIFPNVAAGSVLSIYVESWSSGPITTMEHWFSGPIPVAKGRFTFSHLDLYDYDFKPYGPVRKGVTERKKGPDDLRYTTWEVNDAYPRSDVDFQDDIDVTEPRVALVIRRFGTQQVFESWEEMSGNYEKYALKTSFFQSTKRLRSLVDSLAKGQPGQLEKAQAVFAWVRKNVSYKQSSLDAINPDKVIASGQGNLWEMAVVLREMFHRLDLKTDVLITRPRSNGGFDPAFLSPAQLSVPMVSVRIGKREYLAFPWARGAALGEYPHDYFGLQGLSLADRSASSLPGFAGDSSYNRSVFHVRPESDSSAMELEMEFGGYLAFTMRNLLMDEGKKEVVEAYQKILTRLGTSNNLGKCEVSGLSEPGRPVSARITFSNPNQAVRRKGEVQMRLSHIWSTYFTSYDTTRSSGFKVDLDMENSETLRVPKEPGRALAAAIQCRDISNALFRLTCTTRETPGEFLFQRTVHVNAKRFTAVEMRAMAADIQELNRIKESSLVWKADSGRPAASAGRPAAAKRGKK